MVKFQLMLIVTTAFTMPAITLALGEKDSSGRPVRVALFAEAGCTDAKSREAIFSLLSGQPDMHIEKVTSATVQVIGFMDNYDVFVLPGGTGSGEANAVGVDAGKAVAEAVKDGKGIVAICAGGYYLASGGSEAGQALDIINAVNHDGENWARGEGMIAVEIVGTEDRDTSRTMWFENGPLFKPGEESNLPPYVPLVRYVTDMAAYGAPKGQMKGRDAVIATEYGRGRVVAFGPHPELSPPVNQWLKNAVKWAGGRTPQGEINANTVLEGEYTATGNSDI